MAFALLALAVVTPGTAAPGLTSASRPLLRQPHEEALARPARGADSFRVQVLDEETPAPVEPEETTTPPPPETTVSILEGLRTTMSKELHKSPYQWANALLALIFGLVMILDGEFVFKWVMVGVVFVLAGMFAMSEVTALWGLDFHSPVRHLVGLEVGGLAAYAALRGIDGVMILASAVLGGLAAWLVQSFLVGHGMEFLETQKWAVLVLYSAFVVILAAMFERKGHLKWLAIASPALGGAFATSAISYYVTALGSHGFLGWLQPLFHDLTPVGGPWIDFLYLICSTHSKDVGIFASSSYGEFTVRGKEFCLDRAAGRTLWAIFFIVGTVVQLRAHKKRSAPIKEAAKVEARCFDETSNLRQVLLLDSR